MAKSDNFYKNKNEKRSSETVYNFDEPVNRDGTYSIKYDLREKVFGHKDLDPMWVADMDFAAPSFIREAIIARANHPVYGYTLRPVSFYNALANWMKKKYKWDIPNNWLTFSPGVVPALNLCILAFSEQNDSIIVQPPVYFPFFSAVRGNNRKILYNQLIEKENKYFINFDDFEQKARAARMFIMCHPHNPVGRIWNRDELSEIIRICKKNDVLILSDEIHADLSLWGNHHIPVGSLGKDAARISVTCVSPSKTFNLAGLSTSALIIPDLALRKKYKAILDNMHLGMGNIFGNIAFEKAYENGEEWLRQLITYIENNFNLLTGFVRSRMPEIIITPAEATYLAWIDFRKFGMNNRELMDFICNKAGLALNNGTDFGPGGEGFLRMNIALPGKNLIKALNKLEKALITLR